MPNEDNATIWVIYKSNLDNLASDFNQFKKACDELDSSLATINPINEKEMETIWKKLEAVHTSYDQLENFLDEFLNNYQNIPFITKFQEVVIKLEEKINNLNMNPKPKL